MRIEFITASHNSHVLEKNLLVSRIFGKYGLTVQTGYTNICKAYNDAKVVLADIRVYVHHDVLLPESFETQMLTSIRKVEQIDSNWGVLGVAGVRLEGRRRKTYGYLEDRGRR